MLCLLATCFFKAALCHRLVFIMVIPWFKTHFSSFVQDRWNNKLIKLIQIHVTLNMSGIQHVIYPNMVFTSSYTTAVYLPTKQVSFCSHNSPSLTVLFYVLLKVISQKKTKKRVFVLKPLFIYCIFLQTLETSFCKNCIHS